MEIGKWQAEKRMRVALLIHGRVFGLYRNGIYATLSEDKHIKNILVPYLEVADHLVP